MTPRFLLALLLLFPLHEGFAMTTDSVAALAPKPVFHMDYQGWGLGDLNDIVLYDDDTFRIKLTNVTQTTGFDGMGIYAGRMDETAHALKARFENMLCRDLKWPGMVGPGFLSGYTIVCPNGKMYRGSMDGQTQWPEGTQQLGPTFGEMMTHLYRIADRKLVRLDVDYEVESQPHNFLVTLRFINSGEQSITIRSPATWGDGAPIPQSPAGSGARLDAGMTFSLPGEKMLNAADYPDDVMVIPAGETREARFLVAPWKKGRAETTNSDGKIVLEALEPKSLGYQIDFFAIARQRTMPRNYPATPQEMEEYEAMQRNSRITEGEGWPFKQEGFYRAALTTEAKHERLYGRFVRLFREGEVAPLITAEVDEKGRPFPDVKGFRYWIWQADYDSVIESRPRQPCPKSGRWFASVPSDVPNSAYFQRDTIITVKYGQTMPTVGLANASDEERVLWTWIGP